jgi:hypothetical protein
MIQVTFFFLEIFPRKIQSGDQEFFLNFNRQNRRFGNPRGLLIGQAPGAKGAFLKIQKKCEKIKSHCLFCRIPLALRCSCLSPAPQRKTFPSHPPSIARPLLPHPPITRAPVAVALPPTARATSFTLSPVPSSLLLPSSPAPPSAAPALYGLLH